MAAPICESAGSIAAANTASGTACACRSAQSSRRHSLDERIPRPHRRTLLSYRAGRPRPRWPRVQRPASDMHDQAHAHPRRFRSLWRVSQASPHRQCRRHHPRMRPPPAQPPQCRRPGTVESTTMGKLRQCQARHWHQASSIAASKPRSTSGSLPEWFVIMASVPSYQAKRTSRPGPATSSTSAWIT